MDERQNNKLRMYTAVETVLDAHPDALDGLSAAQAAATDFRTHLADLRTTAQAQEQYAPAGGIKADLRIALTDAATPVAQATATWARLTGDPLLAEQIDFTRSDFLYGREQDSLERAQLVRDAATTHAVDLTPYGVTPALLADLDAAVTAFADALGEPRHAIAERSAHTEQLDTHFDAIDGILDDRLDPLVEILRGTPFYTEYHTARRIVDH